MANFEFNNYVPVSEVDVTLTDIRPFDRPFKFGLGVYSYPDAPGGNAPPGYHEIKYAQPDWVLKEIISSDDFIINTSFISDRIMPLYQELHKRFWNSDNDIKSLRTPRSIIRHEEVHQMQELRYDNEKVSMAASQLDRSPYLRYASMLRKFFVDERARNLALIEAQADILSITNSKDIDFPWDHFMIMGQRAMQLFEKKPYHSRLHYHCNILGVKGIGSLIKEPSLQTLIFFTQDADILTRIARRELTPDVVGSKILDSLDQMVHDPDRFVENLKDREFLLKLDYNIAKSTQNLRSRVERIMAKNNLNSRDILPG